MANPECKTTHRMLTYRLYPTPAQVVTLTAHLGVCCELYNAALAERKGAWNIARKSIGFFDQSKQMPLIRLNRADVSAPCADMLLQTLRSVDKAFQAFFRRMRAGESPGYPRFRPISRFDSMTYRGKGNGFRVDGRHLVLSKVGAIKIKLHRPIVGEQKTVTVKREAGKWYAHINVIGSIELLPASAEHVGIDVGLTHFATFSDGTQETNHRYARQAQAKMRRAQRKIARRQRGSVGRREAVRLFQKAQARVRCQRSDHHHKLSRRIVNRYGLISVEDLNIKGMVRNRHLAKSIHDAGWSFFLNKVEAKAEHAGRDFVRVDPRGTSQHCTCGAHVPKTLAVRWHLCPECGYSAPRDVVSAQIIDRLGLSHQDKTRAVACLEKPLTGEWSRSRLIRSQTLNLEVE